MSTQPNALRLADALDNGCNFYPESSQHFDRELSTAASDASAELRAQHELIQMLKCALDGCIDEAEQAVTDHVLSFGETHKPARLAALRKQVADARAALAAAEAHK